MPPIPQARNRPEVYKLHTDPAIYRPRPFFPSDISTEIVERVARLCLLHAPTAHAV